MNHPQFDTPGLCNRPSCIYIPTRFSEKKKQKKNKKKKQRNKVTTTTKNKQTKEKQKNKQINKQTKENLTVSANLPPGFPSLSGRWFGFYDIRWVCKSRIREGTNWSGKFKIFTRLGGVDKYLLGEGKKIIRWGFTGAVRDCFSMET